MLQEIVIQNFVIAKQINIHLHTGLNVFTGETGAGKTLLMNAILFGIGHSIPKEAMGLETERPYVKLVFSSTPHILSDLLEENGFEGDVEDELILERTFSSKGKNRSKINGQIATLKFYKLIGRFLLDFHGQRETGSLLIPKKQLEYVDEFIGEQASNLKVTVGKLRKDLLTTIHNRIELQTLEHEYEKEKELLAFQLQEIDAASIKKGEWVELHENQQRFENFESIVTHLKTTLKLLTGNDFSEVYAQNTIQESIQELSQVSSYSKTAQDGVQSLETIDSILKDLSKELSSELTDIETEYDSKLLSIINDRIHLLKNIQSKYGETEEDIENTYSKKKVRLQFLQNQKANITSLIEKEEILRKKLQSVAIALHSLRVEAIKKLAKEIADHLKELSMPNAVFSIQLSTSSVPDNNNSYISFQNQNVYIDDSGIDNICFLFQSNNGLPKLPIQQIASGGELSRIMLSIKASLGKNNDKDVVYIFDEIDTGINGLTGNQVGAKLSRISQKNQTLCITHLPQIASFGTTHFFIAKSSNSSTTISSVFKLTDNEIIQEIARMMGGDIHTTTAIQHAEEMIQHAKHYQS